ncbi:ABC transporter permease subunit [Planctomonas sp. JC2975]|uniref:ABC transporter permease n=1 Tax=Planctomonas sp. JC2975 TaxID=2729626 RepID=UPI00147366F0|nr:ABC transporter permease subunit [Planctomonas sp. JC2975]NNC10361.1 ABC transporter permease subunit [Planctomonas sp. JC2975]
MTTARIGATPGKVSSTIVLIIAGILFILPIGAMLLFTFRVSGSPGEFTLVHYTAIFDPSQELTYDQLFEGIANSLVICLITVAIVLLVLLPTMVLVELRYPRMRRAIEFVCLLPITVPTVVLVVGFVPVYQVVAGVFGSVPWTLSLAIGIIVLPYAYRPIQANIAALDVVVLGEAARSLGAGWISVLGRVILPNLRRGILSACFLTIAVVLGEFTIASFLNQTTFQTALFLLQQTDPYVAAIFAVFALVFAFVLLLVIGRIGTFRRTRRSAR